MADNKVRYNEGWIGRCGEEVGEGMGYLELWVGKDGLQLKTTPTGDEVGELNMNGHFASPSGIPYALGDDILGEDGVLFVKASFWKYQLDAIKKMNPQHGQRYRIAGKFVVNRFPRQDGTTGTSVRINVQKFQLVRTNSTASATPENSDEQPAATTPESETPNVQVPF